MPASHSKKIGTSPQKKHVNHIDTLHDTWTVMKPFVRFSIKAMRVMAHALIFIVKNIPKPDDHKPRPGNGKVIKI